MRMPLQVLNDLQVREPCRVGWDTMNGNERTRHCTQCDRQVYDLSHYTKADAVKLLAEHEHRLCVRFARHADGSVVTLDSASRACSRWRVVAWMMSLFTPFIAMGCRVQGMILSPRHLTDACASTQPAVTGEYMLGDVRRPDDPAAGDGIDEAESVTEPDGSSMQPDNSHGK